MSDPGQLQKALQEASRVLLRRERSAVLATHSSHLDGYPYASVVSYSLDGRERPIFLLSSMALHTQNLARNPKAALLVADTGAGALAMSGARLNLFGETLQIADADAAAMRKLYIEEHPEAKQWAAFGDFSVYRMEIVEVYVVAGFGVMGWLKREEF